MTSAGRRRLSAPGQLGDDPAHFARQEWFLDHRAAALVDDMVDSGHTLAAVEKALPVRWPVIKACKTAVLWWKACSTATPDYFVEYLPDNPWIHQPFEVYDNLPPEDLRTRLAS